MSLETSVYRYVTLQHVIQSHYNTTSKNFNAMEAASAIETLILVITTNEVRNTSMMRT